MADQPPAGPQNPPPGGEPDCKKELERKKLELEIHELERPFLQKPAYLSALLPAIIGLATVLVLWNKGYFEVREERQKLEAQKMEITQAELTRDIARLSTERERLQKQLAESELTASKMETRRAELTRDIARLTTEHERLQKQLAESELTASLERLVRGHRAGQRHNCAAQNKPSARYGTVGVRTHRANAGRDSEAFVGQGQVCR